MCKISVFIFLILGTQLTFARKPIKYPFQPSAFKVTAINSQVKEAVAKFQLELPPNYVQNSIKVKLVNTLDLRKDQTQFSEASP